MFEKVKKFIIIKKTILEIFKNLKIATHLRHLINQNCFRNFTISSLQKDPDQGSGSEIPDFQVEDPDP